jgi:N-acetylglucosamine kinase-like BadF-type ATPase
MGFFIGIEGIGLRHHVAVLADASGQILNAVRIEPGISLHTTPRDLLRMRLGEALNAVGAPVGVSTPDLGDTVVCIGLSGVTFPYDAHVDLPAELDDYNIRCKRLVCTGDAEIVFASHTRSCKGSVIICHLGSTAYAVNGALAVRFGGWGPAIGDEGSGFSIGRSALRAIGEEYDFQEPKSALWEEVRAWLDHPADDSRPLIDDWKDAALDWEEKVADFTDGSHAPLDLRSAVFAFSHNLARDRGLWAWRSVTSGLAIPVMKAFRREDPRATDIIKGAVAELQEQFSSAMEVIKQPADFGPAVLYGGMITYNEDFRSMLKERVSAACRKAGSKPPRFVTIAEPGAMRPACGALLFALGGSSTGSLQLPDDGVVARVAASSAEWKELVND